MNYEELAALPPDEQAIKWAEVNARAAAEKSRAEKAESALRDNRLTAGLTEAAKAATAAGGNPSLIVSLVKAGHAPDIDGSGSVTVDMKGERVPFAVLLADMRKTAPNLFVNGRVPADKPALAKMSPKDYHDFTRGR